MTFPQVLFELGYDPEIEEAMRDRDRRRRQKRFEVLDLLCRRLGVTPAALAAMGATAVAARVKEVTGQEASDVAALAQSITEYAEEREI